MLRIGIVFDKVEEYGSIPQISSDQFAEFEPESTILAMQEAIDVLGHKAVKIGGPFILSQTKPNVDVIWNIGEGFGTRNREAWAPVLCELYGIPCLGSDALSLSITLDKHLTKKIAAQLGIPTAKWNVAKFSTKVIPEIDFYPVLVKPRYEGTAKGITLNSIVKNVTELKLELNRQWEMYKQDILIEKLLIGAEYTTAMLGHPLKPHNALERGIDSVSRIGIHALEQKGMLVDDYELSHSLDAEMEEQINHYSQILCDELEIKDFARLDFKCDENGIPNFLEINPLPTFAIDNTFAVLAELESKSYTTFLSEILESSLKRLGLTH
jgi:D-alanine-D-alanine ligase